MEVKRDVFCDLSGVAKPGAIEIADDVVSAPGWRSPSASVRSSVGEIPTQKERILCFPTRRDFALEAQGADRATHLRLGSQSPILGELAPKEEETLQPAGA